MLGFLLLQMLSSSESQVSCAQVFLSQRPKCPWWSLVFPSAVASGKPRLHEGVAEGLVPVICMAYLAPSTAS